MKWPINWKNDAKAINLMIYITGAVNSEEFLAVTGVDAFKVWEDMPEWQRDDYRFAIEQIRDDLKGESDG